MTFDSNRKDKALKTILLSRDEIERQLSMTEVLEAVEVGIEMGGGPATVSARFALEVMERVYR